MISKSGFNRFIKGLSIIILLLGLLIYWKYRDNNQNQLNLIVISIDTLRPDHLGIYGYNKNTSPNIDRWAANSSIFTDAYTTIPFTYPSFASLMTGSNPLEIKIYANKISPPISSNIPTWATILKKNGYTTAAFLTNYWLDGKYSGLNNGFDHFEDTDYFYGNEDKTKLNTIITNGIKYLSDNKDKKMFVWMHILDPHAPYNPPMELKCKFNTQYCDYILKKTDYDLGKERWDYIGCQKKNIPNEKKDILETLYDGEIASTDNLVGKILDTLKDTGLDQKSLVLLYGDHGEGFDHNYYFTHGDVLYNSAIRIPLIIKDPRLNKGFKSDRIINNSDVFFTVLDLLNIPEKITHQDSFSFKDVFDRNIISRLSGVNRRNVQYSANIKLTKFSIYDGRYKYIYSSDDKCLLNNEREELYDITNDPSEKDNLTSKKKDISALLKKELLDYLAKYNLPQTGNTYDQPVPDSSLDDDRLKSYGY